MWRTPQISSARRCRNAAIGAQLDLVHGVAELRPPLLLETGVGAHEVRAPALRPPRSNNGSMPPCPHSAGGHTSASAMSPGIGAGNGRPERFTTKSRARASRRSSWRASRPALGEADRADDGRALRGDPVLDRRSGGLNGRGICRVHGHLEPGVALHVAVDAAQGGVGEGGGQEGDEPGEIALVTAQTVQQDHDRGVGRGRIRPHHGIVVDARGDQLDRSVLGGVRHASRVVRAPGQGRTRRLRISAGREDDVRPPAGPGSSVVFAAESGDASAASHLTCPIRIQLSDHLLPCVPPP